MNLVLALSGPVCRNARGTRTFGVAFLESEHAALSLPGETCGPIIEVTIHLFPCPARLGENLMSISLPDVC